MPVRLSRPWQDSPATMILQQLQDHVKRRAERFLGMRIAAVVGSIAVTAAGAAAGVALHRSVQSRLLIMLEPGIGMPNSYGLLKDKLTLYCKVK